MKITKTSKQQVQAGQTSLDDEPLATVNTDVFSTDKPGLPFMVTIKISYPYDYDEGKLVDAARSFIRDLEKDRNQLELRVDKETGEVE